MNIVKYSNFTDDKVIYRQFFLPKDISVNTYQNLIICIYSFRSQNDLSFSK